MNRFGIEVTPKHSPKLDPDYTPLYLFNQAFLKEAKSPWASLWNGPPARWP